MTDAKDAEVRSEIVDIGTGEFVRVTVTFPLNIPGENAKMESSVIFPARLTYTVVASILGAAPRRRFTMSPPDERGHVRIDERE